MSYPVFVSGDVLNASDMNAVGSWKITPSNAVNGTISDGAVTIGTNVATCRVEGVFSSTYDNYLVTISGMKTAAAANVSILLGTSGGNNFYGSFYFDAYTGLNTGTSRTNNGASLQIGHAEASLGESWIRLEIAAPNLARSTAFTGQHYGATFSGWMAGTRADTVQYTNFTISSTSNMTGGTIRVYGLRN